jgi:peptide/nickel transport system ATP-binding protein
MIFQDPYSSLDPRNSVRYSVARPLRSFGLVPRSAEREAVEELLDQVGLVPAVDFLRRYPHELSGGQRQRVGIARALAAQPSLILADEPTSMLDVSIRLTIMNLLLDLQRSRSLSLVFITHDLGAANYMSDRIAIMYAGRIQEIGPASEVMAHHAPTGLSLCPALSFCPESVSRNASRPARGGTRPPCPLRLVRLRPRWTSHPFPLPG